MAELRQRASELLRLVERGETIEITDRGRPVAMLGPLPDGNPLDRLRESGQVEGPTGDLADLPPPLRSRHVETAVCGARASAPRRALMRATYLDSSAIVKLVISEPESQALVHYLRRRRPLVSSSLARTEVMRALMLKARRESDEDGPCCRDWN